jgi:peptidoglycan/LPS O-acetylase OafA/YrhL
VASVPQHETPLSGLPLPENKLYYPALDGLRAIAVLLVFTFHYARTRLPLLASWGWIGVDLFFVLSGFLITGILYDTRHARHRYRTFFVRRSLRVFPLYYGLIVLVLVSWPLLRWHLAWPLLALPLYVFNYANLPALHLGHIFGMQLNSSQLPHVLMYDHLWSLAVEEQFYLVWPFLVFTIGDRVRLRKLCLAAVVLVPMLRILAVAVIPQSQLGDILYRGLPFRADALLMGAAVALMLRGPEAFRLRRVAPSVLLTATGALTGIWMFSAIVWHQPSVQPEGVVWISTIGYTILDAAAACLLLLALEPKRYWARLLSARPLRGLGRISYGFYIYHYLFFNYFTALAVYLAGPFTAHLLLPTMLVAFSMTLALSWISWKVLEEPFLRLKRKFQV